MIYIKYFLAAILAIVFSISIIQVGQFATGGNINIFTMIILGVITGIASGITACSIVNSITELLTHHKNHRL